ncbi:MAG: hypothetical protein GXP31_17745 [Kiritimatiellaeota bacterium]|nr:hypothetical protein [Kiritimatiellota bacterium]
MWSEEWFAGRLDEHGLEQAFREISPDYVDCVFSNNIDPGAFFSDRGIRVGAQSSREYQAALYTPRETVERLFGGNGIAIRLDGTPSWRTKGRLYFMCLNAPAWRGAVKDAIVRLVPFVDAISQDNLGEPINKGQGNFCEWCRRKFREFVARKYSPRALARLGVRRLDTFDARKYILEKRLRAKTRAELLEDELIRSYIESQFVAQRAALKEIVDAARAEAQRLGKPYLPFYGNIGNIWGGRAYPVVIADLVDVVAPEAFVKWALPFWVAKQPRLKSAATTLRFKLARAAGDYAKPVWAWGAKAGLHLPPKERNVPVAVLIELAEAQANGAVATGNTAWDRAFFRLGDRKFRTLAKFYRFAEANRALFTERDSYARVALVFSVPTLLYRSFSALQVGCLHGSAFAVLARALEETHVPYDIVVLRHPLFRDDKVARDRLGRYTNVILPGVDCMSDSQATILREYVKRGGRLLAWGNTGTRTERFRRRPKPVLAGLRAQFPDRVDQMPDAELMKLARNYMNMSEERFARVQTRLRGSLRDAEIVKTDAPALTWVNLWRQDDGRRLSVHLLNYDIDLKRNAAHRAEDVSLRVKLPKDLVFDKCLWISLDGPTKSLPFSIGDGWAKVTVPAVTLYEIVVFTNGDELRIANELARVRKNIDRIRVASDFGPAATAGLLDKFKHAAIAHERRNLEVAGVLTALLLRQSQGELDALVRGNVGVRKAARKSFIDLAESAVWAFDFGEGEVAGGFKPVQSETQYDPEVGFGFVRPAARDSRGRNRYTTYFIWRHIWQRRRRSGIGRLERNPASGLDPLHRDFLYGEVPYEFVATVPNGEYRVTIAEGEDATHGDLPATEVWAEGKRVLKPTSMPVGVFVHRSFAVSVTDNHLNLKFGGRWGWSVCGLLIEKASGR